MCRSARIWEDGKVDYSQDFFGKPTNLTVSGQLNGETYAMAFRNIYTFGPTFRAENSNTTRHAAEFWMIEPEMAFADLNDDMKLAEEMLKYVIRYVLEKAPKEMEFFNSFIDKPRNRTRSYRLPCLDISCEMYQTNRRTLTHRRRTSRNNGYMKEHPKYAHIPH